MRLRGAVADVPKPLAPVGNAPFLQYLGERWSSQGVKDFVFMLHHDAPKITEFLSSQQARGFLRGRAVRIVVDPTPLGTGGAVAYAVQQCGLSGALLVVNADTWLGDGIHDVATANPPAMAVVRVGDTSRYGRVRLDKEQVVAFEEKSKSAGRGWINAGLYQLSAELFADWDGAPFSLERDLFPSLASKRQLGAVPIDSEFIDIGVPEDYFRFCHWIESDRAGVP